MRRGATLNESSRRWPVVADIHDLEGGEVKDPSGKPSYMRASSGESFSGASVPSLDIGLPVAKVPKSHGRIKQAGFIHKSLRTKLDPKFLQLHAIILFFATACVCRFLPIEWSILTLVFSACTYGIIGSLWLSQSVLDCDTGTPEMRQVSDPIREGAEGFLKVQYTAIAKFAIPLTGLIIISYQFRPSSSKAMGVAVLGNQVLGLVAATGFVCGAVCSALSGYMSMWVAAQSNIRVASAGRRSYEEALVVCFRGGAFSALLNLTLCIAGKLQLERASRNPAKVRPF